MDISGKRRITRNRDFQACSECRRRKLKCDRQTPCSACTKRDDEPACTYERSSKGSALERERRLQAEARLEHLEQLVRQLAKDGGDTSTSSLIESKEPVNYTNGGVSGLTSEASAINKLDFRGSTHWSAMLHDIQGLKSAILPEDMAEPEQDVWDFVGNDGPSLILGSSSPISFQEVLSQYLPPKLEADRLTATYFRSRSLSAPFIHGSSFRRRYQAFWQDPLAAPILWTSILFSIFHIATNTLTLGKTYENTDYRFEVASAHCLALGQYFRPKRCSVESLLLFVQAKCMTGLGITHDVGLLMVLVIRHATRMGYHKDPSMLQLSPFDAEIRRRTWSLCIQLDLLISFQLGLPSNIQYPTWSTEPPRNLLDSDFDEETAELPAARPDSEVTDIIFYIAKHKLMAVFEKILRHTLSARTDEDTDVARLDQELRSVYSAIPRNLRPLPIAESAVDPPSLIVTRLCVSFLYQKCLCVLHRPYVIRRRVQSIQICGEAASNIVRHFNDTYAEFLPGGQLETERWFMSSITWQDYLFGVMALCLVLCVSSQGAAGAESQNAEISQLLRRAQDVCKDQSTRNKDSRRVQRAVSAALLRYANGQKQAPTADRLFSPKEAFGALLPLPTLSDGQTFAQDGASSASLPDAFSQEIGSGWASNGSMDLQFDDASWAYLEQCLNLPSNDPISTSLATISDPSLNFSAESGDQVT